jgi:hypothetical protein
MTLPLAVETDKALLRFNLKMFKNGHIDEMKLSLPIKVCICLREQGCWFFAFAISSIVLALLSSGRHHVRSLVLNQMPKTFPCFEHPNALSRSGLSLASSKFIESQISLYVL